MSASATSLAATSRRGTSADTVAATSVCGTAENSRISAPTGWWPCVTPSAQPKHGDSRRWLRGGVRVSTDIEAVLSGEKRWALIHADNAGVLPTLANKSVAHVITDPPYEAQAHTKQRRVKDGVRTSSWGGADKRSAQSRPLVCAPGRVGAVRGGRRIFPTCVSLDRRFLSSGGGDEVG